MRPKWIVKLKVQEIKTVVKISNILLSHAANSSVDAASLRQFKIMPDWLGINQIIELALKGGGLFLMLNLWFHSYEMHRSCSVYSHHRTARGSVGLVKISDLQSLV